MRKFPSKGDEREEALAAARESDMNEWMNLDDG
jgi:hypothetical protein